MAQRLPDGYVFDPADPRAPSEAQWAAMTAAERARVVAMLPAEVPWELCPPEGDWHLDTKVTAKGTLNDFFKRSGRRIYVSSELAVFYPQEPRFSPDVLAVLDVDPQPRTKWVVAAEGKGLDLVIEVHHEGDRTKDYRTNVERYARLGVAEYFIFDVGVIDLRGYRLEPPARAYRPILPQAGRWASAVLGLDLLIEGSRMRFFHGNAPLLESAELVDRLGKMLDEALAKKQETVREAEERARLAEEEAGQAKEEAGQAKEEAGQAKEEAGQAKEEAGQAKERVAELERQLREVQAENERLRSGRR
jgi:Uma2 family endonuclease